MAAAIKIVFLAIVLVTIFVPPDGVYGIKCYDCIVGNVNCDAECNAASKCRVPNSKTPNRTCEGNQICRKDTIKSVDQVTRECGSRDTVLGDIQPGKCKIIPNGKQTGFVGDIELCVCDKDFCNSGGHLHGTPLFVFGLILWTVVSNLGVGRQLWN